MLRAFAIVLGLIAIGCMIVAIAGMVTGRPGARAGWFLRAAAVLCFAGAVVLGSLAHHQRIGQHVHPSGGRAVGTGTDRLIPRAARR